MAKRAAGEKQFTRRAHNPETLGATPIRATNTRKPIQLSQEAHRRLTMLKVAWGLHDYDAVILRLTEAHRADELGALNIQVPSDGGSVNYLNV